MGKAKDHLKETNWTYWQHLMHSIEVAGTLIYLALMGLVHGVFPGFWANKGPLGIYKFYKNMRHLQHVRRLLELEDQKEQQDHLR